MLLRNKVSLEEHILGKQRCTGPHKQAKCHIHNLTITEIKHINATAPYLYSCN